MPSFVDHSHLAPAASLPVEAFAELRHQSGTVEVVAGEAQSLRVVASGHTSQHMEVQWVLPDQSTALFLDALRASYGQRITAAVANELGLGQDGGPLHTHTIDRTLQAVETVQQVFSGVNFFLEIHCSALARTPAFRQACRAQGIDAVTLSDSQCAALDRLFKAALNDAAPHDQTPLSPSEGEALLAKVLASAAARAVCTGGADAS